jgi:hypothetical protein
MLRLRRFFARRLAGFSCAEIYRRDGKLQIEGFGDPHGVEYLTLYRMLPGMGPSPRHDALRFPDPSWEAQPPKFIAVNNEGRQPIGDLQEILATRSVIERIHHQEAMR